MKILLVSATQLEIQEYVISAPHHDILITGVGQHATTFELSQQLQHHHYDLVIQAGVAGMFEGSGLNMGDVVAVKQDVFGDAGSFENNRFLSLHELGLNADKDWMVNNNTILNKLKIPHVKAITVSTITDYVPLIAALHQRWNPAIESMEGAVLHYLCGKKNIPYVQIRAISNKVGERDKGKWMLGTAINNLNGAIKALIENIK